VKKLKARALRIAGSAAMAAAALVAVASLPWGPSPDAGPARVEGAARGAGRLEAGAAEVPLDLAGDVPIAGFARASYRSEGVRDAVAARAVVLAVPGCAVALVSADLLLVPGDLDRAVRERIADLSLDGVVVAATHTHAGPGGYWEDFLGQRLAAGPYDADARDRIADAVARAIRVAAGARRPARVAHASARLDDLVRNRTGGPVDASLDGLLVEAADGSPIAELIVFPSHPTLLGKGNRLLSGDWPARLGAPPGGGVRLFFQGAVGDQSARLPAGVPYGAAEYGDAVRARVDALRYPAPEAEPALAFARVRTPLPRPSPGAAPAILRRAAANLLFRNTPRSAPVSAVRVGSVVLLAVPAEPVAEAGARLRRAAGGQAVVVSLAGDYLGYVETPERTAAGQGESVRTYYGPALAERLEEGARAAAAAVAPSRGP
jgi:hypothetical protein